MKDINNYIVEKLHIDKNTKLSAPSDPKDPKTWRAGDILVVIGGYSMVLVDYYQIMRATGKSFIVRHLKDKIVSGSGQRGESVPVEGEFEDNKDIQVRINKYNEVSIDGHYASLWDGKPQAFDHMD